MIKIIYSVFLGILLCLFVGVSVSVIYEQPARPKEPDIIRYSDTDQLNEQQRVAQIEFEQKLEQFDTEKMRPYNRNASIIILAAAMIFLAIGVIYAERFEVIADGFLLGGIFTLLYGIGRGLMTDSDAFRLIILTVSLIMAIGLGYWKFVKPKEESSKTPKNGQQL